MKRAIDVRWNSALNSFQSVKKVHLPLLELLRTDDPNSKKYELLDMVDDNYWQRLDNAIAILQIVETWTKRLCQSITPSIYLVVPAKYQLEKHFNDLQADSEWDDFAAAVYHQFAAEWELSDIHCAAYPLNPWKRSMKYLSSKDKKRGIEYLAKLVEQENLSIEDEHVQPIAQTRKRRAADDDDDDWARPKLTTTEDDKKSNFYGTKKAKPPMGFGEQVVHNYLSDKDLSCPDIDDFDGRLLLFFWTQIAASAGHRYKLLARVAVKILLIPATSTSVEQIFSQQKLFLHSKVLLCLLFLHFQHRS